MLGEINEAIARVIEANAFAGGPFVEKFENEFASFCGAGHGIGVGNGTDALWFALLACGVGPGDEVITVPSTFMATAEAISFCGAKPVFVDVDACTYTMDPSLIERAITPRTKAIVPVHLFGQMADMDPIMEVARKHGLKVVEDACQAHGAGYKGRSAGTIADAGAFSFYPGKNLGAFGEAGAATTNSSELAQKIRVLRDHGQVKKYYHAAIGWNGRMDGIQGAVLSVKLKHLASANDQRRSNAGHYQSLLSEVSGIHLPVEATDRRHVYHIYPIRVANRDALLKYLTEHRIGVGIHYPIPVHRQEAYHFLGLPKGSFPISESCADQFLSLPMFPELTGSQIERVVYVIKEWVLKSP